MGKGGFTLLELLMVVIIIGILASIAMPQYVRVTERARATEAIQLLGAIRMSQHRFKAQSPSTAFTGSLNDLDFGQPLVTKYWGNVGGSPPAPSSLSPLRAVYTRAAGAFSGQTLGMFYDNGELCGTFSPMSPPAGACP